jgi:glycosyltransferase involved in cell wall biosynthesis
MASSTDRLSLAFLADPNSIHTRRWVGWFAAAGHRTTLLVQDGLAIDPGLPAAIEIERYRPYTRRRVQVIGAIEARRSLGRILERVRPDVLHAHYLTGHGWHARMSGFHPFAVTLWGSDILQHPRHSRRSGIYARLTLGAADLVTGDSQELVDAAVAFGAHVERTHLVQFGVDTRTFSPAPENGSLRERLGLRGRRILFSARSIKPLYRQLVILDALARLPEDVALVMTRHWAQDGEFAAVEERIRELDLGSRVVIVPTIDHGEMADFYRMSEAVVSIPASDGTPVTLLEAMACGRPTVASDLPSVREWLGDLDPEALVPVDDVEATSRALAAVLARSAEQRAAFAEHGRAVVIARAGQDVNMALMEGLYREAVAGRG